MLIINPEKRFDSNQLISMTVKCNLIDEINEYSQINAIKESYDYDKKSFLNINLKYFKKITNFNDLI